MMGMGHKSPNDVCRVPQLKYMQQCVLLGLLQCRFLGRLLGLLLVFFVAPAAHAQSAITYSNTTPATMPDNNCTAAGTTSRTFIVPVNYIVADVDIGVFVTHTYRSDLRINLISPIGTNVVVMTWTGNVQGGNNLNDLFNDEAATAITAHNATVNDPTTPAPPAYSHSFRPSALLSAFDGQDAVGTWTMTICDAVGADLGTFNRADLFITPRPAAISVTKISNILSDGVSITNAKAIPGSTARYCFTVSNAGPSLATNVAASDVIPTNLTYVAGSMFSGTSCAAATTPEDDNVAGADESDPVGASITGTTITATSANLAASGSFAIAFDATVN
jgi:uncharacterized repeat protein (TIGR01451 family)